MWQLVLLQFLEMVADELSSQPIRLTPRLELRQKALAHIARSATNRLELHHNRSRLLNQFFSPAALRRDLFVGGVQPSVRIEIAYHGLSGVAQITFRAIHVKLPFKVLSQRRRPRQELFESRRVLFVFEFLRFI